MSDYHYGEVRRVERLTDTMIRVVLGGGTLERFESTGRTDEYINALFLPADAGYAPPFDVDAARSAGDHRPRPRRFTVRDWDATARELTLDFVAHGDVGFAGAWAQRAVPGDRLQFRGPSGGYDPHPEAAWHLFVGDESALPAIARSVEALPAQARAVVVAVVDDATNELPLAGPPLLDVHWLHRATSERPDELLVDAVAALDWPAGAVDVFVHGEAGEVRAVRRYLLAERGVDPSSASISPYWRRDHTDEAWRSVKREWIAAQALDVV